MHFSNDNVLVSYSFKESFSFLTIYKINLNNSTIEYIAMTLFYKM